jgi:hypothetical protein
MAILLQKVIASEYAFVIYTADPNSGDRSKIFGEVVAGLGEVLVGSYPGRAFSFTYNEDGSTGEPLIFCALLHCSWTSRTFGSGDLSGAVLEVVTGLGEVLVGGFPGRAFSFASFLWVDGYVLTILRSSTVLVNRKQYWH